MHIPELSEKTYFGDIRRDHRAFARLHPDVVTRSVGWLGSEVPRTGDVPAEVMEALEHYSRANRVADFFLGGHTCEICHGAVLHYIRDHDYLPPDELLADVREKWAAERDDPQPFPFDREWQSAVIQ